MLNRTQAYELRRERFETREVQMPILDKILRGERLSFAEKSALDKANTRAQEIDRELLEDEGRRVAGALADQEFAAHLNTPDFGASPEGSEERAFSAYLRTGRTAPELRAAGEATGSAGGFLVPPGWWQRLQVALKAYGGTGADFQPLPTDTGNPMQWATVDPTATVGTLIAENTGISDVDYTFGQGTLSAYMLTGGVQKVSFQLAQDSAFNTDQFVQARIAESLGRAQAAYAISGTGSSQPLGIIPALNTKGAVSGGSGGFLGLGTAQKVQTLSATPGTAGTDTTVTELTGNLLAPSTVIAMIRSVDRAYRSLGAKWYMNDAQLAGMRLIVDGFGRPYYPTLQDDVNPTLMAYPVVVDNNIPNLTASTTGGPIFGHLPSAMVLRTVKGAGVLRLEERYADALQVGYIGYMRIDIRSNDTRAAVTVKPAAS